jgi:hypothetical protein
MTAVWRKCSSCKKEIPLKGKYYECSVSTCNNKRTGFVFCSVPCFEVHVPSARHRDSGAVECFAPSAPPVQDLSSVATGGQRRIIKAPMQKHVQPNQGVTSNDILIVVSKLKKYVTESSGMNTSQSVVDVLSDRVRTLCDQAVKEASLDGRKTIMDRDFK